MTEMIDTPAAASTGSKDKLKIERVYSIPGVHPYDEVTWDRRDVVQTNWRTGETVFEQRDVEFPDFWSVNASTIVTSKYFRGAVGTEQREWSLKQLIDRVVGRYVEAAVVNGYMDTENAEIFAQELTWMLLHQVFSFNSPVWFNVGTTSPQQVSACFILSVDDTMDSILNWYREEGLIFKGGSGAGLNLSRIRSSQELLSSGGNASGPVSFMRGADASAGTIKSGGATRRAAKMVVLDVDHPDVEEFIETKAREEEKIRVLRDAGFDMDLGGQDIVSVQYQNANNSVRVNDLFMEAVEGDKSFDLLARATGEALSTVQARELFRKMATAAWACADPGIQYDGTINDWHTNPETGRITASNPCFTADTRVHTDKGLVRFDDLFARANTGEEFKVYTHDATNPDVPAHELQLTTPKAFLITGQNDIVRLRLSGGQEIRCTPSHRFWTVNRGYVEAKDLTSEDRLLPLDISAPAVNADWSILDVAKAASTRAPGEDRQPMDFPEVWSTELAHYLGWLIGDGSTSNAISTIYGSAEDRTEILPRHQAFLEAINGGRPLKVSEQQNGTAQLRLSRGSFRRFLEGLGVGRATSVDKHVPHRIFEAPEEIVSAFLRGLFDADGTAVHNAQKGSYVGLGSSSPRLLREAQELLSTLGVVSRIYRTKEAVEGGYQHKNADGSITLYDRAAAYQLRITGKYLDRYMSKVGFDLSRKAELGNHIVSSRTPYETDFTVNLVERIDEGVELTYNLSEPRNHSYVANGIVVRNCSEYLSLDNSSCNLASLNLMKFLNEDGTFDTDKFRCTVELVITAMEISISFADFPTEAIGDTTRDYRQLGIGYANLGALLMSVGHAYDSPEGRALAGAITSMMTAVAYRRSAEIAGVVGAYKGYEKNASAHTRVMNKHRDAAASLFEVVSGTTEEDFIAPGIVSKDEIAEGIAEAALGEWEAGLALGAQNGWRNAQASVLAPTGTIGFMMDCDTTGIEPDFALTKFKKLVGGGSMQIVNGQVAPALRFLGYQEETVEAIEAYIAEKGHVIDAPGLHTDHYSVFDCAVGERAISPMGHIRMMAAAQPFLSGAISKTVNLPESATIEDVEDVYFQGWKLGLKAIAIYRDNCKVGQPLSNAKSDKSGENAAEESEEVVADRIIERIVERPARRRLPAKRSAETTSFTVGGAEGYLTAGLYDDGKVGELFVKMSKQGSTLAGIMDAFSIAVSLGLQYGVPLEAYVSKFTSMRFEPAGLTDDPDIRMAQSLLDYIFRRVALDHLPYETRVAYGIFTAEERIRALDEGKSVAEAETVRQDEIGHNPQPDDYPVEPEFDEPTHTLDGVRSRANDAPLCLSCGTQTVWTGACAACPSCGLTTGCS